MQADYLAANAHKALPRLLERVRETAPPNQAAFVSVPTQRMVRAALLAGWPLTAEQRAEGSASGTHAAGPLLTA
jgi:hypothetical protein